MYIEITLFKRIFYLQIGRELPNRWCAYWISWGELWFEEQKVVYATLHGLFFKSYSKSEEEF